jgi:hypothetical protein
VFDSKSCSSTITISNIEEYNKLPSNILIQGIQVSYISIKYHFLCMWRKMHFSDHLIWFDLFDLIDQEYLC